MNENRPRCKYHNKGYCKLGQSCSFSHTSDIFALVLVTEEESVTKDILANVNIGLKEHVGEATHVPIFTNKKTSISMLKRNVLQYLTVL